MNSLAQLVSDLDLDETLVMQKLKRCGLVPIDCWSLHEIPESDCPPAIEMVMRVLKEP